MDFTLINVDPPRDDNVKDDRSDGDSETYQAIQTVEQQPILTGIDKKRAKKTAECPKCLKMMSNKTLEYSHKCSTPKPKQAPTEESLYEYIVKQDRNRREQQQQRKQEQFNKMIQGAF